MNLAFVFLFIFLIYLFFVFLISKFNVKFCAICASIFLTWLTLIILKLYNLDIDILFIGILMGQSITGLLYLYENYFKIKNRFFLSFRIFLILFLTYFSYMILRLI